MRSHPINLLVRFLLEVAALFALGVTICNRVGARLGVNLGYLKFTPTATWNPF